MNQWLYKRYIGKEVLRKIKGGEVILFKLFFSEPIVSELENNCKIMLFLVLPQIMLENSDFQG